MTRQRRSSKTRAPSTRQRSNTTVASRGARAERTGTYRVGMDKDFGRKLRFIPPLAERKLSEVARKQGNLAPLLLLTKYFLRPERATHTRLTDEGLVVPGFESPLPVDPADRAVLGEWLSRRSRMRSKQSIWSWCSTELRDGVIAALAAHEAETGEDTSWRELLDVGVVRLRELARERLAEAAHFAETPYRELVHDVKADPDETLRTLTTRTRRILAEVAAIEAAEIESLMSMEAQS